MRATSKAFIGLGVLLACAAGISTSAGGSAATFRFGVQLNSPTGDYVAAGQKTELDGSTGFFAGFDVKVNDRFSLEPALDYAEYDIEISQSGFPKLDFGEVSALNLTLNGNIHLMPESKFDLYLGPTVGYMSWDDIDDNQFGGTIATEDAFAIGAGIGIDIPFGESRWSFAAAARYLAADLAIKGGPDLGVDPLQLKVGLARDF